ncbi:hypothetical protein CAPTEDRAFT_226478 [Capitella teleta]|uniref:Fibronectin type-III domain-containing protein n=1 Tax=Capitella teleta TaxID=283909 RepID=R7UEU9_CAPTE|nr:hypothetical protein CAPTEDRAFT_226478 [Capitella teleta]|eukprot:ELU02323.1 hypothetical protein CAPTEDRAFT_226478 [Capitella teleta]
MVFKAATILLLCSALFLHIECQIYVYQNAGLTEIPEDIPLNVKQINLRNNSITNIDPNSFSKFTELTHLDLVRNKISTINDSAFEALVNLKTLMLFRNELEEIPALPISTLEYLELGRNKIGTINDGAFEALVNLKTLFLTSNELEEIPALPISTLEILIFQFNKISTVNDGAFEALVNLKTLDLLGNELENIPVLSISSLQYLRLDSNKISTINDGAFEALVNLKTLDLSWNELENIPVLSISTLEYLRLDSNKISTINDGAFEALVNLKTLDLSWNELEEIPVLSISTLEELNLEYNKISTISDVCDVGFYGVNCEEECGRCKDDLCSDDDGHCLDGCQIWFLGDLCKEEIALPSLDGSHVFLKRMNESAVAITWTQDPGIPDKHAEYYGYTVAYAEGSDKHAEYYGYTVAYAQGSGDFTDGPSVPHDPALMTQTLIVANVHSHNEYRFEVKVYREMSTEREFGVKSNTVIIESSVGDLMSEIGQWNCCWASVSYKKVCAKNIHIPTTNAFARSVRYVIDIAIEAILPFFISEVCDVGFYGVNCEEECGRCKDDLCSSDDGHCSDGCQIWFLGDLCKEEIALPSLDGSHVFLKRMNESAVAITWTQDPGIPDKHAEYYGYTVAYAEGSGDFIDGPSVPHNASIKNRIMIVANIQSYNDYRFNVLMYRKMDGEQEYGLPSATTRIESGSNYVNWELVAVGVSVFIIITAIIIIIIVLLSRRKQAVSGDSEQNKDNVCTKDSDSVAQASVLRDNSAGQPAPVTEPSPYEPLETDERRDLSDPYTALEGVYQQIDDRHLP